MASTTTNNVVTYTVIVSVDNTDGFAIPGMTANVSIIVGKVEDVLCVENRALKFTPPDNDKKYEKQGVWILTSTGPKRYDIELGLSDDNKTQIISNEIKEGDRVIISTIGDKKKQMPKGRPF